MDAKAAKVLLSGEVWLVCAKTSGNHLFLKLNRTRLYLWEGSPGESIHLKGGQRFGRDDNCQDIICFWLIIKKNPK